jgi:hypothetical protein
MIPQPQQIALDLDPDGQRRLDPPLEPERVRQLIALMADAIVALVEPLGRTNDDDD